jgi:ABC-type transport system involved in multi-copper enzyme maturation permease subunit
MRAFLEIFRFECRYQLKSPLYIAVSALFFLIHFLTARKLGINIGIGANQDSATIPLNAAVAIIQNELVLSMFVIFPAVAIVAATITRDHERTMAELFFVRPIREPSYVLGRFAGGLAFAVLASLAGALGGLMSLTAPGIDPERLGAFAAEPWWFVVYAVAVPNTMIAAALVFSAAAAARSIAAAFCAALVLAVIPFLMLSFAGLDGPGLLALVDPFGTLAIIDVTRFWTGAELASELPGGVLFVNRALWLGIAAAALLATVARYRFVVQRTPLRLWRRRAAALGAAPTLSGARAAPHFGPLAAMAQLMSQLRMDLRAILRSPPFYLVLAIVVLGCADHFAVQPPGELLLIGPREPLTSLMIGFLDTGLAMQLLLFIAYYAGVLVHGAREARVAEIADASPVSTAIGVVGKIGALWAALTLLLGAGIVTFIVLQAANGYTRFELALYLKGLVVYGFNHYALVVPAVLIHLLFSSRWLGTLSFLAAFALSVSLAAFDLQDVLYTFRLPMILHSDMNGFGHFAARHASLIAYWSAFLVLATVAAHLVAPRGCYDRFAHRIADARSRVTHSTIAVASAAAVAFVALGAWIFYNTHVLNEYVSAGTLEAGRADYEKKYRRYAGLPVPFPTAVDMAIEFFPAERRVESRGTMQLVNNTDQPIEHVLVTLNPELTINALDLGAAAVIDDGAGGRVYRFAEPLAVGATVFGRWDFSWRNDGFDNLMATSNAVAENGTYLDGPTVMPTLLYDAERQLVDAAARSRHGLSPAGRLPDLDDPEARRAVRFVVAPADVRVVLSTSEDQTAVGPGSLQREWREGGRRYFEYRPSFPVGLAFASARYVVTRDSANGIPIEIYHDAKHSAAVATIMSTAKRGLEYYGQEFGPYVFGSFRIFEYPRYSTVVDARLGVIAFNEGAGFFSAFGDRQIDFVTGHELGHMWWGGQVRSPVLQGMLVLNEALSSYSALMLREHVEGRAAVRSQVAGLGSQYLDSRSRQRIEELPIVRSETAIAGTKGVHAMYALRDLLGADRMNLALKRFIEKYGNRPPPYPTTRELVAEIRAVVTDDRHQALITDWLERITLYDVAVTGAESNVGDDTHDVTIEIAARQLDVDGAGVETEVPLNAPFDVAVFAADADAASEPIYLAKHWLTSGAQRVVVRVPARPGRVAVDPYGLMLDRRQPDNFRAL